MLIELKVIKGIKHTGKTFNFTRGLNTITGSNEVGKSVLIELCNFALFGSQALRLPANAYDSKTEVRLIFTVRGQEYTVARTLKEASLMQGEKVIAKSTSVVNQQINKLLGYGYDVYQVANLASQNEINYLSSLKPTPRKKMIDKTLGLFSTKKLIEAHKVSLRELNSALNATKMFKPSEIETLLVESDYTNALKSKDEILKSIGEKQDSVFNLNELIKQQKNLSESITNVVVPTIDVDVPESITLDYLNDLKIEFQKLEGQVIRHQETLNKLNIDDVDFTKKLENTNYSLNLINEKIAAANLTKESLQAEIDYLSLVNTKKKLLAQGSLTCEKCDHVNYFASSQLGNFPDDLDLNFKLSSNLKLSDFDDKERLVRQVNTISKELHEVNDNINYTSDLYVADKHKLNEFTKTHSEVLNNADKYKQALLASPLRVKALTQIETLKEQLNKLPPVSIEQVNQLETELNMLKLNLIHQEETIKNYQDQQKAIEALDNYKAKVKVIDEDIEKEKKILETLDILLSSIRTEMLPKINAVASTWVRKISLDEHQSVNLTDDMDLVMDNTPLDAFSGSGKAVAHIALRLALAQILTRGVFPVFMGDEIDASMDNNRANAVLSAFKEMLTVSSEQIILISHKDFDVDLESDNAIKL